MLLLSKHCSLALPFKKKSSDSLTTALTCVCLCVWLMIAAYVCCLADCHKLTQECWPWEGRFSLHSGTHKHSLLYAHTYSFHTIPWHDDIWQRFSHENSAVISCGFAWEIAYTSSWFWQEKKRKCRRWQEEERVRKKLQDTELKPIKIYKTILIWQPLRWNH